MEIAVMPANVPILANQVPPFFVEYVPEPQYAQVEAPSDPEYVPELQDEQRPTEYISISRIAKQCPVVRTTKRNRP
jgi:hypothetical protein